MNQYAVVKEPVLVSQMHPITSPEPSARTWNSIIFTGLSGIAVTTALLVGPVSDTKPLSEWTRPPLIQPALHSIQNADLIGVGPEQSTASIVRDIYTKSGLTWEQLGRLLGVSRRAVHLWVAGGRINSRHLELLNQLHDIVEKLPAENADQRRVMIFQARQYEPSIFDAFLRRHSHEDGTVAGTPYSPDQLFEAH